jgi:hypothetical protein
MAGTLKGGQAAAETNKKRYGDNFYRIQGAKGGSISHPETRPFRAIPGLAARAGRKGGIISRRPRKQPWNNAEDGMPKRAHPAEKGWIKRLSRRDEQ